MEEKTGAPPLLEESLRSTKKVRIREDGEVEGGHGELDDSDVVMKDEGVTGAISYRAKLLNLTQTGKKQQPTGEVVVTENDYLISRDGNIPVIEFSKEVRAVLVQGMEKTLIIKVLGRSIMSRDLLTRTQALWRLKGSYQLVDMEGGFFFASFDLEEDYTKVLTGGPWMVFGAYLAVQPWSIDFDPRTTKVSNVVVWVRIPGLSFRYYHKSTLRAIGMLLGDVVKLDYTTETRGRGRYARIAVMVDLQNPLIPWIKVDGRTYGIEYECLPLICFECGKYGHTKEKCGGGTLSRTEGTPLTPATSAQPASPVVDEKAGSGSSPFGSWMQVRYPKKGNKNHWGKEAKMDGITGANGSRYNILVEYGDLKQDSTQQNGESKGIVNAHEGGSKYTEVMADHVVGPKGINQKLLNGKLKVVQEGISQKKGINQKLINGNPKVVQEYRQKSLVVGQGANVSNGKHTSGSQSMEIITPLACIDGVSKPIDEVGVEGHAIIECPKDCEEDRCSDVAMKGETLTVVRMESTLDQSKHTVVELHQQRHTLEEVQHPNVDNIMGENLGTSVHGGISMGKENLGAGNNWAKGLDVELIDSVLDVVRMEVENCDSFKV
ncbi:hypothetical protein K1719_033512 [Acacia pycnantha]|nr:hypothetical protein K1719_033512 [Acacia pycnantha]